MSYRCEMYLDCYRLLYKPQNYETWLIYKPLKRNQGVGAVFDTLIIFNEGTHRQVVKKHFWKTYKIDIDRLPEFIKLDYLNIFIPLKAYYLKSSRDYVIGQTFSNLVNEDFSKFKAE